MLSWDCKLVSKSGIAQNKKSKMFPNYWQTTIGMLCLVMSACQSPFLNGISSTLSSSHSKTATDVISTDTNYRKGQETAKVPAKFTISTRGIGDAQIGLT